MAKGNWNPDVIKPKTRCRICGYVIKKDKVFLEGVYPAHKNCAERNKRDYTEKRDRGTEIEITDSVSILVD